MEVKILGNVKEGKKEGRKEGREGGREGGRKEGRKEGREERRGRKGGRNGGRKEGRKERRNGWLAGWMDGDYLTTVVERDYLITVNASGLKNTISIQNLLLYITRWVRETAFKTLVRPTLEYGSAAWDPYYEKDIHKLERVQRKAFSSPELRGFFKLRLL